MLTSWSFVFKYFYTRHENLGFSYVRSPHDEFAIKKPLMGGDTFITCVTPGEGIGSMALRYVTVMTAAYKYGRRYVHTPFSNVGHQPLGYDGEEWAREWDAFLGLGAEEDQDIPARAYQWCYQEVTGGDLQQLEGVFRSKYYSSLKPPTSWFDPDEWNIAIHVRRGDALDPGNRARITENSHILALLRETLDRSVHFCGKPVRIHVMSEGERETFSFMQELGVAYDLHLNEDTFLTFHHLVKADILVTSKSTFSYFAGILNGYTVFYEKFWHEPLPRWKILGEIDATHPAAPIEPESAVSKSGLRLPRADEKHQFQDPDTSGESGAIVLIVQRASSSDPARQAEFDLCLETNLASSWFSHVEILDGRSSYRELFALANRRFPESIVVIANSDITFDVSLLNVRAIVPKELWALTRWESPTEFMGCSDSQDVWIFRTPMVEVEADFPLGVPGCDNRIAKICLDAGYDMRNPSLSVRAFHHHASNVRTYSEEDRVPGPYLNLPPTI